MQLHITVLSTYHISVYYLHIYYYYYIIIIINNTFITVVIGG